MKRNAAEPAAAKEYLEAVAAALRAAGQPDAVAGEVVAGVRGHIEESVRRRVEAGEDSDVAVAAVLGELDAPEDYAEGAGSRGQAPDAGSRVPAGGGREAGRGRAGRRGCFWLALAFLLVNGYGVWRISEEAAKLVAAQLEGEQPVPEAPAEAPEGAEGRTEAAEEKPDPRPVLVFSSLGQIDYSENLTLRLALAFNAAPDREMLSRFLTVEVDRAMHPYEIEEGQGDDGKEVVIRLPSVEGRSVRVTVAEGMPARDGDEVRPSVATRFGTVEVEPQLEIREVKASCAAFERPRITVKGNLRLDMESAKRAVSVEPAVKFTVEDESSWHGHNLVLRGDFRAGRSYRVTLGKELRAENGKHLRKEFSREVEIPPPAAGLRVDVPGRYLAPRGGLKLPVSAQSLREAVMEANPVPATALAALVARSARECGEEWLGRPARWWDDGEPVESYLSRGRTVTNAVPVPPDGETAHLAFDLRELSGLAEPRGAWLLRVRGGKADDASLRDERLVVATDLGLSVRLWEGGALAWVNSLGLARAAEGARVEIRARNGRVLAEGTADAAGLARLAWETEGAAGGDAPLLAVASLGDDLTFVELDGTAVEQGEAAQGAEYLAAGAAEAAVYTERGVYRPGDALFGQAILRGADGKAPPAFPVQVVWVGPDGRDERTETAMPDETGTVTARGEVPVYWRTGKHRLQVRLPGSGKVLGETAFSVEDFVAPQTRVTVQAESERVEPGEKVRFRVEGKHMFGSPAADLQTEGYLAWTAEPFRPEQWPDWSFGDGSKSGVPGGQPLGMGRLDGNGTAYFTVRAPGVADVPARLLALCAATVTEPGGRSVTGYGTCEVETYPFFIGLRPAWEGAVRTGETQRVAVVEVLPDGSAAGKGTPLVMRLVREEWFSAMRRTAGGKYEWTSERRETTVAEETFAAGGTPADFAFSLQDAGSFALVACDPKSGASTRISFQAGSGESSWVAWSRERPGRVELVADREWYAPGETARVQVRSPFAGHALATVEREGVVRAWTLEMEGNTAELEVPLGEEDAPNVHVALSVVRPAEAESVWSAHRAAGAVALRVRRPAAALAVSVEAPERARPQEPLRCTVRVADAEGHPASGKVTVMAVDEAICGLTAHATPVPARTFEAVRRAMVELFDPYGSLIPIAGEAATATPGAGGDAALARRKRLNPVQAKRFKPVALWHADLPLDAGGCAEAAFDLPEFSGELRLMAVARNAEGTGSGDRAVAVRRDLVSVASLPRFLAPGDACEATVKVVNPSGRGIEARVKLLCSGPLSVEPALREVQLEAGGEAVVSFDLRAGGAPGTARCVVETEGGGESFREDIELAVRPAGALRASCASKEIPAGGSARFAAPGDWLAGSATADVALDARAGAEMVGAALAYVLEYPYGCLEQTTSASFPLLRAGEWLASVPVGTKAAGDPAAMAAAGVSRILSMQQGNGGFAMWPFSNAVAEGETVYAAHFLVEAKAAGIPVPEAPLRDALGWLRRRLDRPVRGVPGDGTWQRDMELRAYICRVLAMAGTPEAGWNARLEETAGRLGFAARVHVAAALVRSGEPRRGRKMLKALELPASWKPRTDAWDGEARSVALLLDAWLDLDPRGDAASAAAERLANLRNAEGHWGSTQDNAMALLALCKMGKLLPEKAEPFAAELAGPGWTAEADGMSFATNAAPAGGKIEIRNAGPGPCRASVRFEGAGLEPEPAATNRVSIRREFFDQSGKPLEDVSALPQGTLFAVKLTVVPAVAGETLSDLVVEDLLPAGWEIENPNLVGTRSLDWVPRWGNRAIYQERRDDRVLVFLGPVPEETWFYYAVRAVTPGDYVLPPATVSGMYDPAVRGVSASGRVRVLRAP